MLRKMEENLQENYGYNNVYSSDDKFVCRIDNYKEAIKKAAKIGGFIRYVDPDNGEIFLKIYPSYKALKKAQKDE